MEATVGPAGMGVTLEVPLGEPAKPDLGPVSEQVGVKAGENLSVLACGVAWRSVRSRGL
jgi:hypothetical protein